MYLTTYPLHVIRYALCDLDIINFPCSRYTQMNLLPTDFTCLHTGDYSIMFWQFFILILREQWYRRDVHTCTHARVRVCARARVLARLFFCFLWVLLCLHFLWVHSVHGSFWFSRIHFHLVLGQKFFLVFSVQIFLVVVHFNLLMSRPHIRMLLQVLLRFYIFLVLNFYLVLLISLALHMNSNIGFCW